MISHDHLKDCAKGLLSFSLAHISTLFPLPPINDRVRHRRYRIVCITVISKIYLRNTFFHSLHEVRKRAQAVRIRRLAVGNAGERYRAVVQQEADERLFGRVRRRSRAKKHLSDEV